MNIKATLINKTPHPITFLDEENNLIREIPKSLEPIRILSKVHSTDFTLDGIPITKMVYDEETLLPAREEGVWYIVSPLVKSLFKYRTDLLVPNEIVKMFDKVIGCRSLGILDLGGKDNADN